MRITANTVILGLALLLASAGPATAEENNARQFGEYTVHYNTLSTDMLPAEVASAYAITRSRNRGMLNITVVEDAEAGGPGTPIRARVTAATVHTLTNRYREVSMREITDGEAVYYIGTFPIRDEDRFQFQVNVQPRDSEQSWQLRFDKQFYVND